MPNTPKQKPKPKTHNPHTLYEIAQSYRQALDAVDGSAEMISATIDGMEGAFDTKAEAVAMYVQELWHLSGSIQNAILSMADRAENIQNKAKRLEQYLLTAMQHVGKDEIETPYLRLKVKNNPTRLEIAPDAKIPDEYMVMPEITPPEPRVDKRKLLVDIQENGVVIDGVMAVQDKRLEIK